MKKSIIGPKTLSKMRRGAEKLYISNREKLTVATVTVRKDIASEIGLKFNATTATTKPVEKLGLFDDEPEVFFAEPTPMVVVKLTEYIEALKNFGASSGKQDSESSKAKK